MATVNTMRLAGTMVSVSTMTSFGTAVHTLPV